MNCLHREDYKMVDGWATQDMKGQKSAFLPLILPVCLWPPESF